VPNQAGNELRDREAGVDEDRNLRRANAALACI
jgi:hypothetical protein